MITKSLLKYFFLIPLIAFLFLMGCERDIDVLEPATYPVNGAVFLDGFSAGLDYQAFSNSKVDAMGIDLSDVFGIGPRSLKISVPSEGDPTGWYAGGAFVTDPPRDMSGFNALTFYAKTSINAPIGLLGFGNDNTGFSKYDAWLNDVEMTTVWKKYVIPMPDPSKSNMEQGMFQYSAGAYEKNGYYLWFDEIQFENLGTIAHPRPAFKSEIVSAFVGDIVEAKETRVVFDVSGTDIATYCKSNYFTFSSSNESVAKVDINGVITVVGEGKADITGKVGTNDASGVISISVGGNSDVPAAAPETPTIAADKVISLFSNAYTDISMDTWSAEWEFSTSSVEDIQIGGDDAKRYTNLNFSGILPSSTIDASEMNRFSMDFWTPDTTAPPASFKILLVDFGNDGIIGGGDDASHEISLTANTTPAIAQREWARLDIPLSDFAGLTTKGHIGQLVISGEPNTVYLDNVFFYIGEGGGGEPGNEPTVAAPTPTADAASVVSLFSNPYTDQSVDTWAAEWEFSTSLVSDVQIAGDDTKKYINLNFAGIEFTSQPIDASATNTFHMDIWTPDATAGAEFKIKLVDFGANGVWDGGGDDSEHEITISNPTLVSESWVSIDVPMSAFSGLTSRANLAQMIISSDEIATVFMDNVYFYAGDGGGTGTEPTTAAPTPSFAAADVISLFSSPYSDVNVDTWSAEWDSAEFEDVQVAGEDTKLYTNLVFAGIEFTSQTIDANSMTHFHMNVWTPDPIEAPVVFKIKLVDFGPDGEFDGGDDTEHELSLNNTTTPAMGTGNWVSLDIPLSDFAGLTTKGAVAQLIISGDPNTMYIDNILFHK